MSFARTVGMGVASLIGFVVGAYLGLYLMLTTMDWGQPFEAELIVLAIVLSTGLAVAGGILVAPNRGAMWRPMTMGALGIGVFAMAILLMVDADPAIMAVVGLFESVAIAVGARTAV